MPDRSTVVITGAGVVSAAGLGYAPFRDALRDTAVLTRPIDRFEVPFLPVARAAHLTPEALRELDGQVPPHPSLAGRMFAHAGLAAVTGAGLRPGPLPVMVGSVMATRPVVERHRVGPGGAAEPDRLPPEAMLEPLAAVGVPAVPGLVFSTGCSAGNVALARAASAIRHGRAERVLAGGADELSMEVLAIFASLRTLAGDVVRPFDARRDGTLPGEGAAAFVVESWHSARARAAPVLGVLLGSCVTADAHHITAPHPEGVGLARSVTACLASSGIPGAEVDWVCAHGTGTRTNDALEAGTVAAALGPRPEPVPISSVKGGFGHAQGAAAALEVAACLIALEGQFLPGTANHQIPDDDCGAVRVVPPGGTPARVRTVMSPAFGFGGTVSTLLLGRAPAAERERPEEPGPATRNGRRTERDG